MITFARASLLVTAVGVGAMDWSDAMSLVQKGNIQVNSTEALAMQRKVSSLVNMIDLDLTEKPPSSQATLQKMFDCTRGLGLPAAGTVKALSGNIDSLRSSCRTQTDGKQRRACAVANTNFLSNMLKLILYLPKIPSTCFKQDCSAENGFVRKVSPVMFSTAGVFTITGMMSAIAGVDTYCIDKTATATPAPTAVPSPSASGPPDWLGLVGAPFSVFNSAYSINSLARGSKDTDGFRYGICASVADFTGALLGSMGSLISIKASNEAKVGKTLKSAQWNCAGALNTLISNLPGVISATCSQLSCKRGEEIAKAEQQAWEAQ